ncbi:AMP-binding protein [Caenimonas soli]|uniref:AMP-binding protein n=1 Tax=Caenimonas soli TaxID=2735555 RepID=UPI001553516D|nr:AMP-binding protein [Caenimonas soli]NPC59327.1 AMP-binding protein [Caenimonas soli]
MSYAELRCGAVVWDAALQDRRGRQLAGGLSRLGLSAGDVVAVMLPNVPQYADVVHACAIAGTVYCAINWHFKAQECRFLLEDSQARVLVVAAEFLEMVAPAIPATVTLLVLGLDGGARGTDYETWLSRQAPYDGLAVAPGGSMPYTSGTSGRPKGIVRKPVAAEDLLRQQQRMKSVAAKAFGVRDGCRALIAAPVYHSAPGVFFQSALKYADCVVLAARFDAEQLLADVQRHRITTAYLVPLMYVRLLRLPHETRRKYDTSSLRFVASTGAPCAPEVKAEMIRWLGPVIFESYGSSETGMVTVIDSEEAMLHPGSVGRPVDDASIRIVSAAGEPCAPGETGLIYVRQPAFPDFSYRGNDAARAAIERGGHITLGDIGYLDESGFLYICDRASDMVISGGVNIYPAEVESVLITHPAVADCAVFGIPDEEYGERLHALIEPSPGQELDVQAIGDWLRRKLAAYKVPRSMGAEILPRDDSGKIAKRLLRDRYWQGRGRSI